MDKQQDTFDFIIQVLKNSISQFFSVFGILVLFGILLYLLSRSTRKTYSNSGLGFLDVIITGWIGTPVHELGHALFCILFGHRIKEIKLFKPNSEDGTLGYVKHAYDSKSLIQRIGCFFIGIGPILLGTAVLFLLMYFLLPNYSAISNILSGQPLGAYDLVDLIKHSDTILKTAYQLLIAIFAPENFKESLFWVFVYLSFSVASHMQLSISDLKSMITGLIAILLIFLLINLISSFFDLHFSGFTPEFSSLYGRILNVFILASAISFANFSISYLLLAVIHLIRTKRLLSFW